MPTKATAILTGIRRVFPDPFGEPKIALDNISLTLCKDQITAIVGPSGSGKTTLFNILACLDSPTAGFYHFLGHDIGCASEQTLNLFRNRRIGLVFQRTNLIEHVSLQKNVEIPLELGGGKRYKVRAADALDYVGLSNFHLHKPEQISFFQRRLAELARSIVMNPSLLLLDDPFIGLDWFSSLGYLGLLQKISLNSGIAIFLTASDPQVAEFCNRGLYISEGHLQDDLLINNRRNAVTEKHKLEVGQHS